MSEILTVTERHNLERMISMIGPHEGEVVVVYDLPKWEGELSELLYKVPAGTLVVIPFTSKFYVERSDIKVYRYGNALREAEKGIYYPNNDPGRMMKLPEGMLSEIAYAFIESYGLSDDVFSSFTPVEDPFYIVHTADEIEVVLRQVPLSVPVKVIFDSDSYEDPKHMVSALSRASMLLVKRKGIEGEKKFSKALDRLVFSPVIHKLASFLFFDDEEDVRELLNDDIKCIRMFFRGID